MVKNIQHNLIEKIKRVPVFRYLYRLPWLLGAYHFLLAFLGAVRYGFQSRKLFVVGVTGTKGKSSTLEILSATLEEAGKKTALLGSVRKKILDKSTKDTDNTMPGRFVIQKFLRDAVKAGVEYALLEVTSEGVVQYRHRFIDWDAAFFLNLAPEHIERHGSFKNYRAAKVSFFSSLSHSRKPKKYFFVIRTYVFSPMQRMRCAEEHFFRFPAGHFWITLLLTGWISPISRCGVR